VLVAYAGRVVEEGTCADVFARPAHPYTRRLLAAIPDVVEARRLAAIPGRAPAPGAWPAGCAYAPRCEHARERCAMPPPLAIAGPGHVARCVRLAELPAAAPPERAPARAGGAGDVLLRVDGLEASYGARRVLHGVELALRSHECLALVGESGSGKTTLGRAIIGLIDDWRGTIEYAGTPLSPQVRRRPATVRRELQYIFQSPYNSLNPRCTIGDSIALPVEQFFGVRGRRARERVEEALDAVALPAGHADRYPDELSGGERQRAAIARGLASEPRVLICDEVTSALDVSVQAAIVELLARLQRERGLALLFVTHDLALVRTIADRVMVLHDGVVVDHGTTGAVLDDSDHAYTRRLLADTPRLPTPRPAASGAA
jgi:peptide/nickel transport system ATP-binding protein